MNLLMEGLYGCTGENLIHKSVCRFILIQSDYPEMKFQDETASCLRKGILIGQMMIAEFCFGNKT